MLLRVSIYNYSSLPVFLLFFFNDTATTEIYTLSLHDALPIYQVARLEDRAGSMHRVEDRAAELDQPLGDEPLDATLRGDPDAADERAAPKDDRLARRVVAGGLGESTAHRFRRVEIHHFDALGF